MGHHHTEAQKGKEYRIADCLVRTRDGRNFLMTEGRGWGSVNRSNPALLDPKIRAMVLNKIIHDGAGCVLSLRVWAEIGGVFSEGRKKLWRKETRKRTTCGEHERLYCSCTIGLEQTQGFTTKGAGKEKKEIEIC